MSVEERLEKKKTSRLSLFIAFVLGALTVAFIGGGYLYANSLEDAPLPSLANPNQLGQEKLMEDVSKLVKLPEGETPEIASVGDVTKLAGQPFFAEAQNGDMVLVYQKAQKAVLYRPALERVINYSQVNLPPQPTPEVSPSVSGTLSPSPSPRPTSPTGKIQVTILNGSKESGLAGKAEDLIENDKYEIALGNAVEDYATSSISVIGSAQVSATELQNLVKPITKVKVASKTFPPDEAAPAGAQVVIILGEDFAKVY